MSYIYDEPILDGEATLAPEGWNFSQLEFEIHGSELIPLASSSMIRSSPIQLNQSMGEQIEVNKNESDTSHHIADKYQDLGVGVIDEEGFKYLEQEIENVEGVKDDDIVVTLQVQHKQKSNAEIAGKSRDPSVINEEEIVVENDERHVIDRDAIDNAGDVFLQYVHQKKSIQVRGPQIPVTGSPSKKKLKKTSGVSVNANILKSPAKNSPRKRKVPKSSLNWGIEMTKKFVSECENFKQEVQGSTTIPPATWKSISAAMTTNHGVEVDWDICRDKFIQMRDLFLETLLPVEGYLAGQKWPYYDEFCTLYDIPIEFHSIIICRNGGDNLEEEEEDDDEDEAEPDKGSKLWPTPNVELLLDLFKVKKDDFESTKSFLKHDLLYSQLALELNDFTGRNYKSKQCQDKMGRLNDKFRKEYDSCNKTGAKPSTWPFYERMLDMFKGSPNLIAPYVASVGRGLLYSVKDQVKASCSSEVDSRNRPKNKYQPKERKQSKGKTSVKSAPRNKQQELQERKVANQENLTEEIRLLRLGLEEGRRDRKKYIAKLLDDNSKDSLRAA